LNKTFLNTTLSILTVFALCGQRK